MPTAHTPIQQEKKMEWWGYHNEHGWVVLDRSMAENASGLIETALFFRFRDSTTFTDTRKNWHPPLYMFAPNYLKSLPPAEAAKAAAELETVKSLWPEQQRQLRQTKLDAEAQAEAARVALELQKKKAVREKKKQLGLSS
jgi:hypothetical protein